MYLKKFVMGLWLMACASVHPLSAQETDWKEMESFIDGIMAAHAESHNFPGASFALVKDGEVKIAKGYGYKDIEQKTMNTADTLFRPGSISKLFTWVSVMQQVERGNIDLNADVNIYLKEFQLDNSTFGPITMMDIFSHTPGTEDGGIGFLMEKEPKDIMPLAEALKKHMPARIWKEGTESSYSNWATTLAGYIVQEVSGVPFLDYVEQNIFQPLGMSSSSFREPLPDNIAGQMASGYEYKNGHWQKYQFEIIGSFAPAGALSSSAHDMARFMIAIMNGGELEGQRILKQETVDEMLSPTFRANENLPGFAHGFYYNDYNDITMVGHGGDTIAFHSDLMMYLKDGLGIYVSYNAPGGATARDKLVQAIVDKLYPATYSEPVGMNGYKERAAKFAGNYRYNRHSYTKTEKAITGMGLTSVSPTKDGTILVTNGANSVEYIEVSENVFKRLGKPGTVVFDMDDSGAPFRFHMSNVPMMAWTKIGWFDNLNNQLLITFLTFLLFLGMVKSMWAHRKTKLDMPMQWIWARRLSVISFLLSIIAVGLFAQAIAGQGLSNLIFAWPDSVSTILMIPYISQVLTWVLIALTIYIWVQKNGTMRARIHLTLFALGNLFIINVLDYWNLIGFQQ